MKRETSAFTLSENKRLWNMRVTVIPVVIAALGIDFKGLKREVEELKIEERIETI